MPLLTEENSPEYWLALLYVPGLSLKRKHHLLQQLGSPKRVLDTAVKAASQLLIRKKAQDAICCWHRAGEKSTIGQQVDATLEWANRPGNYLLTLDDARYPERLATIAQPPLVLFVIGNPQVLTMPQVAMVGSRNASAAGLDTARLLARELATAGLVVTSGLARGIDGCAHQGALEASAPTIAVMATGADRVYPRQHRELAQRILSKGALITEFPLGTSPRPELFPQRNRIISGLSLGVLVVEAAVRSGSLISARFALEQGREVFAVPGSIHNPRSRGCHTLLRDGAKLVETIDDVLEELTGIFTPAPENPLATAEKHTDNIQMQSIERQVLALVDYHTTAMDYLVEASQIPIEELSAILMQLEIKSLIRSVAGGFVRSIEPKSS